MVRRILRIVYKEFSGLHQAAFLLGLSALASQFLALFRDRLLAHEFGAGPVLDIYYIAFRLPDLVYVSIASFVSVTVLIPFVVSKLKTDGKAEVERFLSGVLSVFCLVMVISSLILFILIPYLTKFIAPGFDPESREVLITLTRILLLSPFLLGLSNLAGSVTQSFNRFFAYTLSPVLYNLGIIFGIIFLWPTLGLAGLAWGVVLGALLHLLIQLPVIYQTGIRPWPVWSINWSEIKSIIVLSLPRTITLSAHQLVIMIFVALGSLIASGSVAVFNFAFNLQSVPLAIIGVSYSVAAFPTLSRLLSGGQTDKFKEQVALAVRHIIFWSLPAAGLFIVLRAQIVRVILGSGAFSWADTRLVAAALALFVFSVAGQGLVNLFVRSYYAGGKTAKPLFINLFSSILAVASAGLLLWFFNHSSFFRFFIEDLLRVHDLAGTAVLMLPLAFTFGMITNTLLFWFYFQKDFGRFPAVVSRTFFHALATTVIAGYTAYLALFYLAAWLDLGTFWGIFGQGFLAGLIGILSGGVLLVLLGNRELAEFSAAFSRRFGRIKPIAPEPEEL
ncbi:MAG: lipid II flippase MurJ [Candidatus Paceibacterota bacterium]